MMNKNKAPSKRGKKERKNEERGPKSKLEEQNPKWVTKGAKEQIMFQSPR